MWLMGFLSKLPESLTPEGDTFTPFHNPHRLWESPCRRGGGWVAAQLLLLKQRLRNASQGKYLVHRIVAFAFVFAMAIPRCQWRHRCVVTLGEILVVLYRKPFVAKDTNESKGGKVLRAMSKRLHGDAAKQGEPSQRWHYKIGDITCVARICGVHRCDLRCSDVVH